MKNLSVRQRKIGQLLIRGRLYKEIADALGITVHVVRNDLKLVYSRYGCRNRQEFSNIFQERLRAAQALRQRERFQRVLKRQLLDMFAGPHAANGVHFRLMAKDSGFPYSRRRAKGKAAARRQQRP